MAASDIVTKDFGWKFFSLALAVIIWWTVSTISRETVGRSTPLTTSEERIFSDLPVTVMSSAADVREFKVDPDVVDVVVRGRPEVLKALTAKEIRVLVDLTDIESAQDLSKRVDVSTPPGVTFVGASPSLVDVVIPPKGNSGK